MSPATIEPTNSDSFTTLFHRGQLGDASAANHAWSLAAPRLRSAATALLYAHSSHHTLQPTALVHESWLKLMSSGRALSISSREHFLFIAARAMRQILTDRGRTQRFRKAQSTALLNSVNDLPPRLDPETALTVRKALSNLELTDLAAARVAWLHYVEGNTWEEISELTGRKIWQLRDDTLFAFYWIRKHVT